MLSNFVSILRDYPPCRNGRLFESSLLGLSFVCFAMGITYGVQISRAQVDYDPSQDYSHKGPKDTRSAAWAVFYYGFIPLITVCVSATGTVFYSIGRGSSLYSLIIAAIFSVGWWVVDGFYIQYDWITGFDIGAIDMCPQSYMKYDVPMEIIGTSTGVLAIKSASGIIIGVVYLVYLSFAAIAVAEHKKLRKSRSVDIHLTRKAGVEPELGDE